MKLHHSIYLAALSCLLFVYSCQPPEKDWPSTVKQVELNRYLGLWYQVARYPHSFQNKKCALSTAKYSLREDGKIRVLNTCWADKLNGPVKQQVEAAAWPADETNSRLKVKFFGLFVADYLIIELDRNDYRWAVVTTPKKNTFWILSRTPALAREQLELILQKLTARGFKREKILLTSKQDVLNNSGTAE